MRFFRQFSKIFLLALAIICEVCFIFIVDYTIWDNNQVNIVRQTVQIEGLPAQFEGFTILQITDLHGKRFGASQLALTGLINSLDYDLIAITGDMQESRDKDTAPFLELLRGIKKKTPIFYISGNTGPYDIYYSTIGVKRQYSLDMATGQVLPFGEELQSLGVTLLNEPKSIERSGARLWFANDFSMIHSAFMVEQALRTRNGIRTVQEISEPDQLIEYQQTLQKSYALFTPGDTLIGIFHIPLSSGMLADPQGLPPYDLVIAGHYHGGQYRLPGYGALYIPDDSLPKYGLLPPQGLVSGLEIGNGIQQYISRGLGASSRIPFLKFRLFDTPEINLITLVGSH